MLELDIQEFGPNSPFDYNQLNKLVLAIREIAGELNEVAVAQESLTANTAGNDGDVVKTVRYTLINTSPTMTFTQLPTTGETTVQEIDFIDPATGATVSFLEPPSVVMSVRHGTEQGICIVNRIGKATNTGFKVKGGFVGKKSGNVVIDYVAIGLKAV